jgi:hypothetical protein
MRQVLCAVQQKLSHWSEAPPNQGCWDCSGSGIGIGIGLELGWLDNLSDTDTDTDTDDQALSI